MSELIENAKLAKHASLKLASLSSEIKNKVLLDIASLIDNKKEEIFAENEKDVVEAKEKSIDESLVKRLKLNEDKIKEMIQGLKDLSKLEDPVGSTQETVQLDERFNLYKVSTPLGVVGAIFESRPDALVQIFALCFKSGNASFLKGGSEAKYSNRKLHSLIREVTDKVVDNATILIESREDVSEMLKLTDYVDLVIPRGSNKFVKFIQENSKIPVLGHSEGLCHAYVDKEVNIKQALKVVYDAKTQYAAACNAIETLLVHKDVAAEFIPLIGYMFKKNNVEMRGDEGARALYEMKEASEEDWSTEYNDYIISIKIVNDINEAIQHINKYGSKHSELIMTTNKENAKKFEKEVDASSVMWNCSTRFADGFRYGKGAETGISTGKIHARGPVGLEGLVIYKYLLEGNGQTVKEQTKLGYKHKKLDKKWQG